jgi:hypothetical protein
MGLFGQCATSDIKSEELQGQIKDKTTKAIVEQL